MQINSLTLDQHLQNRQDRLFLLWGSDTYLIEHSRQQIVLRLQDKYPAPEKHLINFEHKEKAFAELHEQTNAADLFGSTKIILCLFPAVPKSEDRKTLEQLLLQRIDSVYVILQFEKITAQQQKESWYQYCLTHGIIVTHWPLQPAQYKQFLLQQANRQLLNIEPSAAEYLAQMTFGNALAGCQMLEKLALLQDGSIPVTVQALSKAMGQEAIGQDARFELQDLYLAILSQDQHQTMHIIEHFETNKFPLPLMLWGMHQLFQGIFSHSLGLGNLSTPAVLPKTAAFQTLIKRRQQSVPPALGNTLLRQLHEIDKALKSYRTQICWPRCAQWCLQLINH